MSDECVDYVGNYLLTREKLTAFNAKFDGSFLQAWLGKWLNWDIDTYGLFKYLSNEGFEGQSWSLESAQINYLGWTETNKDGMENALKERGLTKADMWQLPPEVLGPYCGVDADAAWQLYEQLQADCADKIFGYNLLEFHRREYMTLVELLGAALLRGNKVDRVGLQEHYDRLQIDAATKLSEFLAHPLVSPHIAEFNTGAFVDHMEKEPTKHTAKGEVSVRWTKWDDKTITVAQTNHFNLNSKQQLAWLFYERIYSVIRETRKLVIVEVDGKEFEVEKTESGQRSVKKQILPLFGEPGALLLAYNKLVKESGYVTAALALTETRTTIHPDYNSVGTVTGRLAGGAQDAG
jgi:DNA polymerase I-like protein with 3'-5' exonuclease and polymerase domains